MPEFLEIDFGEREAGPILGIDLGTTNSLVAVMEAAGPRVIPGEDGEPLTPSVVYAGDGVVVGNAARRKLIEDPAHTVYSVKRLMGRSRADVEKEAELFPFRISGGADPVIRLEVGGRSMTPPEVSAFILIQLKRNAEKYLGRVVRRAVITVPAYFDDAQRQATKDAGRIAGLEVLRLVNEPTAASLAYGLDKRKEGVVAVYDLGGGTFDISILKIKDGVFEVLSTNGDTHLGGDDIDNLLLRIALEDAASEWGEDFRHDASFVQSLRRACVEAKERLSFALETAIELEYKGRTYRRALSRDLFEKLIAEIVDRTLDPCTRAMQDAKLTPEQIDEVVMVGGSTRIPLVRQAVERLFRARLHTELDPDKVVALGAAVQAGVLAGEIEDKLLLDVTPLSLGIETMGGVVSKLIHRNSTIPASATEVFTTAVGGQRNVLIHVLQGERELAKDCRSLARFDLKDIDPLPAGAPRIEVRFLIDANGILSVSARDQRTGREHTVEVKPSYGLTDEQVEAIIRESIDRAEEDFTERQVRESRIEADSIVAAVKKAKNGPAYAALPFSEKAAIDCALNELLVVYCAPNHAMIRAHIEKLNEATMHLAEVMMDAAVSTALKGTKL